MDSFAYELFRCPDLEIYGNFFMDDDNNNRTPLSLAHACRIIAHLRAHLKHILTYFKVYRLCSYHKITMPIDQFSVLKAIQLAT